MPQNSSVNYVIFQHNHVILIRKDYLNFEEVPERSPVPWYRAEQQSGQKKARFENMANKSYMTLKFTSLNKLMDFVRACHVTNYELNVARITLASHFQCGEVNQALMYGAVIFDEHNSTAYERTANEEPFNL